MVTRSLGDLVSKGDDKFIIPNPELKAVDVRPGSKSVMILATDGVWDVIGNQEAVNIAMSCKAKGTNAARMLVAEAFRRRSGDNITAIVYYLW